MLPYITLYYQDMAGQVCHLISRLAQHSDVKKILGQTKTFLVSGIGDIGAIVHSPSRGFYRGLLQGILWGILGV